MDDFLFKQLEFARSNTLKIVDGISEEIVDTIHPGFRNHIRWNLGHILYVQERFAYDFAELPQSIPANYKELFGPGTSPLNWTVAPPALDEIIALLAGQQERIRTTLANRLDEKVANPYTTSSGLYMETIRQFLNFTLYHEGMHFHGIKTYKVLSNLSRV